MTYDKQLVSHEFYIVGASKWMVGSGHREGAGHEVYCVLDLLRSISCVTLLPRMPHCYLSGFLCDWQHFALRQNEALSAASIEYVRVFNAHAVKDEEEVENKGRG